ncbi:major facilitator superfamily domain-containing protein [Xylogone sp. PMI_703]|nr:major facilitator superfamily domain-containing protein [Xylogone sp. PMI_703]
MSPQNVEFEVAVVEHEPALQPDKHPTLKLDPHGYPLRPQPSDDPLGKQITLYRVFPAWKVATLLQVAFLAFLGPFTQGYINPAYAPLAKYMHITITEASYNTTTPMVTSGAIGLLLSPISNIYGRRPVYIFVSIIGIVAGAGSAISKTWGTLIVSRFFVGVGLAPGLAIGAAAVSDMFFMHERGKYMGIYVIAVTNGAHIAALCGGFTAQQLSWRWSYWVPCITLAISWLVNCFCLPETLCHRDPITRQPIKRNKSRLALFTFRSTSNGRRIKLWDITHCFLMLKYPSVLFCFVYYAFAFGIGTILFAVTSAAAFGQTYHFNVAQVGMAMGLSTTIGSVIGEFASGTVSDRILYLFMKRHDGEVSSEARLTATWPGAFLLPAGIIIEGVCLEYKTHWSGPVLGIGIASFGLQIVSTNIYAYLADCYTPQNAEISVLLNFGRTSAFPFTLGFFMLPFAKATNFGVAWSVMALISVILYGGIILLMWKGKSWREKLGAPNFDRDL